jgi:hypothetical protein
MIRGSFALTPDAGIPFVTAVDAETDRLRRAAKSTGGPFAPRIALAADALRAVVAGRATAAPGLATINLVIDWPALARGHVHSGERSHIIGGGPIPPAVVRELFRNAFVKLVLTDGVKVQRVLHVGRRLPAAVRTALELGPPPEFAGVTCAAPTCERRYGLEWDHKDPVAHGGATTFANMQPLCGMSHRDKTRADRAAGLLDDRRPPRVRAQEPRPVASVDPTVAADPMAGADRGDPAEGRAPP